MIERDRCRAAITGIGMVTPFGPNARVTWSAVREGRSAARLVHLDGHPFPAAPACVDEMNGFREPAVGMAVAAADEALRDAGWSRDDLRKLRAACTVSCSKGGLHSLYAMHREFLRTGKVPADFWTLVSPSSPGQAVARAFGLENGTLSVSSACATGVHAIVAGIHLIETNHADIVVAGSTDASLVLPIIAGFDRLGGLSRRISDPQHAARPFDRDRDGFVVGEGAGVVVLESLALARRGRGRTYAHAIGSAWGADAHHFTRMREEGRTIEHLIRIALMNGRCEPREIDYVNAHGTGTVINDPLEAAAIARVLGDRAGEVPVSSFKGAMGHLLGAAGSVEIALTALALREGVAPPNVNLFDPDPDCACLNLVRDEALAGPMRIALKIGSGFGGHIGVLLLERGDRKA